MDPFSIDGTIHFPITVELFGHHVQRQARVKYKYVPAWPCLKPDSTEQIDAEEDLSMIMEVFIVPEQEIEPGSGDSVFPSEPQWVNFTDFLSLGFLEWRSRTALETATEADAWRQDQERRAAVAENEGKSTDNTQKRDGEDS